MAGTSTNNNWERIQQGVNDTERLIGQREYNGAMVKARQTLEYMVKQQAQRACIAETSDLKELIDMLYENRWISKTTCEHYHKIRMIGNKAVHEDYSNAYDANQAYHMLSQEVYTFANDYRNAQKGTRGTARRTVSSASASGGTPAAPARPRSAAGRTAASSAARSRKRTSRPRRGIDLYLLLKLLVPILSVILLIFVIRLLVPEVKDKETTAPETTAAQETTAVPETTALETMAPALYRTTTVLNVRSQPNTDGTPLGKLAEGTTVDYVEAYDDEWAIIRYNGEEAYVASRYLTTE